MRKNYLKKLHLGCESYIIPSWLNSDINPKKDVVFIDASKKLPFNDSVMDYIFCEHMLEHLTYLDGKHFMKECFRILKPGGKIRISTPDLKFLIALYHDKKTKIQKDYIKWMTKQFIKNVDVYSDTFVINAYFRKWGHKFIYDYKTLKNLLETSGFSNVSNFKPELSNDPNLSNLENHWKFMGKKFNQLETFVLEATKPPV